MAVLLCLAGTAWLPASARADWQNFNATSGGLVSNSILTVAEDRHGALWFGTVAGASRYDGSAWSTTRDSLPNPAVYSLLEDQSGRRWFGTGDGIGVEAAGHWQYFFRFDPAVPGREKINALLEDHAGDIWAGTDLGLLRYRRATGTWTVYQAQPNGLVNSQATRLLEDRAHRLWIATPLGVGMLDSTRSQWSAFRADPNALGRDSVFSLCEDAQGRIWFGTDEGAWSFGSDGWHHRTSADGLPGQLILSMACDTKGRMWFGGLEGVSHGDSLTLRYDRFTMSGQRIGPAFALAVDASGNVWTGGYPWSGWLSDGFHSTTSQGVFRFDGVAWRNYFYTDPTAGCFAQPSPNIPTAYTLPGNCMTAGLQDHAGELWFGTLETGVARLDRAGAWSTVRRGPATRLSDSVSAVVEDRAHTLWFASPGSGLAGLDSTRAGWTLESQATGLPSNDVRTLFVDAAGELWAGTAAGAARRSAGNWLSYPLAAGAEVQRFAEDTAHRLWVQAAQGLFSIDAARAAVKPWTTADGLLDDFPTAMLAAADGSMWIGTAAGVSRLAQGAWTNRPGSPVRAIRQDAAGNVWVASEGDLSKWDGAAWEVFRAPAQLPGLPVLDVYFEPNGAVWAATPTGVGRYDGRSWKKLDSKGNGLTVDEVVTVFTDTQERMWVLGVSGLAEHEPDLTAPQTVFVNTNERVSPSRNVSLVFGAAYGELADLEYKSSWDGQPWTDWTTDNTWYRQGVADGTHTFSVRARDWAGNVDPTPATYTFEIDATPPAAEIASPSFGLPVRGACAIVGTTADARFRRAFVQARPFGTSTWPDTLVSSTTPVTADTLAVWDTTALPDGDWEIRVAVDDTLGLTGIARVRVIVDNVAPFANVTSPVRLVAGDGGDVYTTNAEAHLYFPPNAFDADPVVSVDSLAAGAAPDTLPGGALRRGPAWQIGWTDGTLRKDGVLELRPWGPGGGLAVWRSTGAGAWERLGGSPQDGGALALTLTVPGRYAVFTEGAAPKEGGTLSTLTLTPRAFSPSGGYAATEVAIGFTLASPGAATVKVYNRAGRLVRVVERGMSGVAGENLVHWNGHDEDGHVVDPGLYIVTVEALGETLTRPVAVVK